MNKKKILALSVCIAMLAIALIGGTMAYFTDEKEQTNTFTAGNVEITLDEAIVEENSDGNLVATGSRTSDTQEYRLYPAQSITKDPTITVVEGSEATYIAAKVIVTNGESDKDLHDLIPMPGTTMDILEINGILSGGLLDQTITLKDDYNSLTPVFGNTEYSIYQKKENDHSYVFYIFMENAIQKEDKEDERKIVLFEIINIPDAWDNEQMNYLKNLKIKVEAYAVQQHGFDSCFEAVTAAFGGENEAFDFN